MKKVNSILLIDDDTVSCWLSQLMLERSGLVDHIDSLHSGQAAIDYLQRCCNPETAEEEKIICPDLIFLDLDMPIISGFDVLDFLQQSESCAWLIASRVIVLTTSIQRQDMERAKKYNIYDFITKPLTESGIAEVLESYLNHQDPYEQPGSHQKSNEDSRSEKTSQKKSKS